MTDARYSYEDDQTLYLQQTNILFFAKRSSLCLQTHRNLL
jgi:hypothetical protein